MTFDVFDIIDNNETALIVGAPTGIFYSSQTSGLMCEHPEYEGFVLPLFEIDFFDDCSFGCHHIPDNPMPLADALQLHLRYWCVKTPFDIDFDYLRITELREGWWPVKGSFEKDGSVINFRGVICQGNCD